MKRFSLLKTVLITSVVAVALVLSVNAAQATPGGAKAVSNGAIVTRLADGCSIFDPVFGFIIGDLQDVQTPSGNEKFTCIGQIAAGLEPDHAVVESGTCTGFTGSGTADLRFTPSGNAIATCQIKK